MLWHFCGQMFQSHKSKLFARKRNNHREILVEKTIRPEAVHTEKKKKKKNHVASGPIENPG